MAEPTRVRRRSNNRGGSRAQRASANIKQLPWRNLENPFPPIDILTADQIEDIHNASLTILEDIGLEILSDEAADLMKEHGADISSDKRHVKFDRNLIAEKLKLAPSEFTLHARNPAHNVHIGGKSVAFCSVSSAPNSSDVDGGRRPGNQVDFRNFLRLGQSLNIIHLFGGYPVEPIDIHPSIRHLECSYDFSVMSDKVFYTYALGRERLADDIEMTRIARGVSHEQIDQQPSIYSTINSNSPLKFDGPMLNGILDMARRNQAIILTPFTLAGAMAPVTLAGALAQQNAEALAGIALAQMARPGAPVVYGGFTSNVDMRSGAPAFGTPEYTKAAFASGQLARRHNVPYRSSAVNASNAADAQSAYETEMALWGAVMGGSQLIKHAAGWLEGGLCASFEKLILDVEMLQMMAETFAPIEVNDDTLGLDSIREAGPGGHFFGTAHTQERYETAFYAPMVSDWQNFESWQNAGSLSATARANTIFKQLLKDYEEPAIDEAIKEELAAYVAKRKEEGGAPTDF